MTQHIDMFRPSAPSGQRCPSARTVSVTTFCHPFRGWQTARRHRFLRRSVSSRATPTRHCLRCSPQT